MKNYDYWKRFVNTGKIDDYLHYIACTREDSMDDFLPNVDSSIGRVEKNKEGGLSAGIDYRDGDGPVSHAVW